MRAGAARGDGDGEPIVHLVVPAWIDDDRRVSGGNVYDRRIRDGLRAAGWRVEVSAVDTEGAALALRRLPDAATVLIDGLVCSWAGDAVVAEASRLRIVVLAHMPPESPRAFAAARAIVATSDRTRAALVELGLDARRISVARPGVDDAHTSAAPHAASVSGGRLLCVGVLARHKGQDLLVAALGSLAQHPGWTCVLAGSGDTDPAYAAALASAARAAGIAERLRFAGPLDPAALAAEYDRADLVVAPSRAESYGMAVADALARGVPVLTSDAGGLDEATAWARPPAAQRVRAGSTSALTEALREWLDDAGLRAEAASLALAARASALPWSDAVDVVARALAAVAARAAGVRA